MSAVEGLLERLERVKRSGRGWEACCPAHDDRHASLSVGVGGDGRALVRCHAGCSAEAVARAAGLELGDLFEHEAAPNPPRVKVLEAPAFRVGEADIDRWHKALADVPTEVVNG